MQRGWIEEEKYLLQHLVHVVRKQVVESRHCLLSWVCQGCQSGRPMVKLFTKDPQPRALPRAARPLLDGPLDRLLLGRNGALTTFHFGIYFYATKSSTTESVMSPFTIRSRRFIRCLMNFFQSVILECQFDHSNTSYKSSSGSLGVRQNLGQILFSIKQSTDNQIHHISHPI